MRRNQISLSLLAIAFSACVAEPELLNSERIRANFGSFGIDVLAYKNNIRRSNLFSLENGQRICRTYAVVRFENVPDLLIGQEHTQVLAGHSIGSTYKANDWEILKQTQYTGSLKLDGERKSLMELMRLPSNRDLAMHVYRLALKKQDQIIEYATIIEVHHPDYLDENALSKLFEVVEAVRLDSIELAELSALALDDSEEQSP